MGTSKADCCQHLHLAVCGQSLPAPVIRSASATMSRTRRLQDLDETVAYSIAVGLDRQLLAASMRPSTSRVRLQTLKIRQTSEPIR